MYTIKRAAGATGISEATLRAWERRYGVVTPSRTDSGYRLYDDAAVRDLTRMKSLVDQGWAPREAAQEVIRGRSVSPISTTAQTRRTSAAPIAPPVVRPVAGARPVRGDRPDQDSLIEAAAALDPARIARILDDRFSVGSFESVVDRWLMPTLTDLGHAWADGQVSVAGEHLVAHAVQRRLAAMYEAAGPRTLGPRVLIGLPAGARHDLGLFAFATAARRAGLTTGYIGADVPKTDWAGAARAHRAACVVLAAPRAADLPALADAHDTLSTMNPPPLVAVGGRHQDRAPQGCLRLGHDIAAAATFLAEHLATTTTGRTPEELDDAAP